MSRPRRMTYRGAMHHVTMRCNNKEFLFEEKSFRLFLDLLRETCQMHDVPLYNYCLMTNHVHLLFKVRTGDVLSSFMHRLAFTVPVTMCFHGAFHGACHNEDLQLVCVQDITKPCKIGRPKTIALIQRQEVET